MPAGPSTPFNHWGLGRANEWMLTLRWCFIKKYLICLGYLAAGWEMPKNKVVCKGGMLPAFLALWGRPNWKPPALFIYIILLRRDHFVLRWSGPIEGKIEYVTCWVITAGRDLSPKVCHMQIRTERERFLSAFRVLMLLAGIGGAFHIACPYEVAWLERDRSIGWYAPHLLLAYPDYKLSQVWSQQIPKTP